MKIVRLFVALLTLSGLAGCNTMASVSGYTKTSEIPAPTPPPKQRSWTQDYIAAVLKPDGLVNYERTASDGSGIMRASRKNCVPMDLGAEEGFVAWRCIAPPKVEAPPASK